ncbi:hypothetical protein L1049_016351 [Liquidambar formosana]|uniref:Uncharacterized protein n=1 Tax=Liquidambar formosana TaxID=63359 RepID=A0AAP0RZN6_LIQFO
MKKKMNQGKTNTKSSLHRRKPSQAAPHKTVTQSIRVVPELGDKTPITQHLCRAICNHQPLQESRVTTPLQDLTKSTKRQSLEMAVDVRGGGRVRSSLERSSHHLPVDFNSCDHIQG